MCILPLSLYFVWFDNKCTYVFLCLIIISADPSESVSSISLIRVLSLKGKYVTNEFDDILRKECKLTDLDKNYNLDVGRKLDVSLISGRTTWFICIKNFYLQTIIFP